MHAGEFMVMNKVLGGARVYKMSDFEGFKNGTVNDLYEMPSIEFPTIGIEDARFSQKGIGSKESIWRSDPKDSTKVRLKANQVEIAIPEDMAKEQKAALESILKDALKPRYNAVAVLITGHRANHIKAPDATPTVNTWLRGKLVEGGIFESSSLEAIQEKIAGTRFALDGPNSIWERVDPQARGCV